MWAMFHGFFSSGLKVYQLRKTETGVSTFLVSPFPFSAFFSSEQIKDNDLHFLFNFVDEHPV